MNLTTPVYELADLKAMLADPKPLTGRQVDRTHGLRLSGAERTIVARAVKSRRRYKLPVDVRKLVHAYYG